MERIDYYADLELDPGATQEQVRAAYKRLALRYHPDRSPDPGANKRMQRLNEAFTVLASPEKRALYDQERQLSFPLVVVAPPAARTVPVNRPAPPPWWAHPALRVFGLLRRPLRVLFYLVGVTMLLFFWALFTGEVSGVMVLALVVLAVWVILSVIFQIRYLLTARRP